MNMKKAVIQILQVASVVGVAISSLIAIILVLDPAALEEVREAWWKTLLIIGILTIASALTFFIVRPGKKE